MEKVRQICLGKAMHRLEGEQEEVDSLADWVTVELQQDDGDDKNNVFLET